MRRLCDARMPPCSYVERALHVFALGKEGAWFSVGIIRKTWFMPEPDSAASSGTRAAKPGGAAILRGFWMFLHAIAGLAVAALIYMAVGETRLIIFGENGMATVIDLDTQTRRVGRTTWTGGGSIARTELRTEYRVADRFSAAGRDNQKERMVSWGFFEGLVPKTSAGIRYLLGRPETNEIDPPHGIWGIFVSAAPVVFLALCGALFQGVAKTPPHA